MPAACALAYNVARLPALPFLRHQLGVQLVQLCPHVHCTLAQARVVVGPLARLLEFLVRPVLRDAVTCKFDRAFELRCFAPDDLHDVGPAGSARVILWDEALNLAHHVDPLDAQRLIAAMRRESRLHRQRVDHLARQGVCGQGFVSWIHKAVAASLLVADERNFIHKSPSRPQLNLSGRLVV